MRELEEIKIATEVFEIAVTPEGVTIVQVETEKEVIMAPSTIVKGKIVGFKKQKVIVKKDCYYISALNKKNALDKLFKK